MKQWAERFYKSRAWQECRQAFLLSKFYLCERCGAPAEIAHHKVYLNESNIGDANVTMNFDNLEALCWDCHNKEHSKEVPIGEGLAFDAMGNIIQKKYPSHD